METADRLEDDTRALLQAPDEAAPEPAGALRVRFETEKIGVVMRSIMPQKRRRGKLYTRRNADSCSPSRLQHVRGKVCLFAYIQASRTYMMLPYINSKNTVSAAGMKVVF